ncbi:UDP-N-acetylmuramoyl-L-alanyl-D-glutamate--2,6-diaminopimelate ligase [Candidatus Erwinia haradaeae]|uniref:UDP-N-acetylmuramoyl-L-alanyl-D-glutamate--2,6-diaminopimelate ligase n=1 Tax=Candidatus Erwinia haradaeae TaxID=1922217 RepID=A0A451D2I4_9GAMM|nr:UDP-N-acetylmuramoyl-L-alanyl-D-glutamate--2,6-diaminopimelate ligase [Candidatus Erwinia haradaeae]VFP79839.1 UDP-N-acetylmuramoyl-L-alanyl-D-glutamate--2, 6-diaminopimelate ligase [Candidatus Erwinia haradaeae]
MKNRNLSELLAPWSLHIPQCTLREITLDSRNVSVGDLFVAINGHITSGRSFISQAINQGAVAVISETKKKQNHGKIDYLKGVPIISMINLSRYLSEIAGRFYQNPGKKLKIIGVTGTNGKTTTTHLLAQWVKLLGEHSAVMGTLGNGCCGKLILTKNTTDSAVDVQRVLSSLLHQGVKLVGMEISSHALVQNRVADIPFSAAVFTNLSHDHLDYHGNMINYENSKWKLFSKHKMKEIIINYDDPVGYKWLKKLPNAVCVSINNNIIKCCTQWLKAIKIKYHENGSSVSFRSSWGCGTLETNLIGSFNISNLFMSLATLLTLKYPLDRLIHTARALQPITGRMQIFTAAKKPKIIIDYAHTPDALEKVLIAIRYHCKGKLWCLFGCGGDRDKGKRPLMGKISEKYADILVITNDNPRNEHPRAIINDILSGLLTPESAYIITDRKEAISYAITYAKIDDIILIAGKGSENYQTFGVKNFVYSDQNVVSHFLRKIK